MAKTRSSARTSGASDIAEKAQDVTSSAPETSNGKRKAESTTTTPTKKENEHKSSKKQKTIEEMLPSKAEEGAPDDTKLEDTKDEMDISAKETQKGSEVSMKQEDEGDTKKNDVGETTGNGDHEMQDAPPPAKSTTESKDNHGAIEVTKERERAIPSNILEKGIIYFFMRGRVEMDDPHSVQDIQRSFLVLRPLPKGAKITDGALDDSKNIRLLALPKKTLPKKAGGDRFLTFVEKSNTSIQDLKDNFFPGSENETKTVGVRHTPPVTPIGEGVYAITSTGRETHLTYMLTIPSKVGEVQEDMGIQEKASFIASTKNPDTPQPANARLPQGPKFSQEVKEDFAGRRWLPLKPDHLNFENAQILLIGEKNVDNALAPQQTKGEEKETPGEELERLEEEDEARVQHLRGDDSIYEDLGISQKEYPDIATTW